MKCPLCGSLETSVKDSRLSEDQRVVRRRRLCESCGFRFTTIERAQLKELCVIKKNGIKEPFDREKIERSLRVAIHKGSVTFEKIESIVSDIIRQLEVSEDATIETRVLGEMVLEQLLQVDPVAYVRFASIYKKFESVEDFVNLIQTDPK